ncbi:MAG: glycosyltransferase family 39 protein, partial [Gammaproteobacteria bacterium]
MSGPRTPLVRDRVAPDAIGAYEYAGLVATALILLVFRLHAFDLPLETDECNYAVIGARLLAGDRLYVDVWDHQPFGVFTLFAAVIAVFGNAAHVFRWMALLFSAVSLLLIFAILRRAAGRGGAILGALLFAIASSDPGTGGEGCNREVYMNTLILAAWYFGLRTAPRPSLRLFASGTALAIASSLKTIVAVHWVFLAVWIVVSESRQLKDARRGATIARRLLWFSLGPAILWGIAFGY